MRKNEQNYKLEAKCSVGNKTRTYALHPTPGEFALSGKIGPTYATSLYSALNTARDRFLTADQAAEKLKISVDTLRKRIPAHVKLEFSKSAFLDL